MTLRFGLPPVSITTLQDQLQTQKDCNGLNYHLKLQNNIHLEWPTPGHSEQGWIGLDFDDEDHLQHRLWNILHEGSR